MSKVVLTNVYKLKKDTLVSEFKEAAKTLKKEYISKLDGCISFHLMFDKDKGIWSDQTVFETFEDAKAFASSCESNELAKKFCGFIDLRTCRNNLYTIEATFDA